MSFREEYFGEWKPISRYAGIGWLCFYFLFLVYAARDRAGFLFLDYANLMIHECGHPLFSPFGYTIMIMGGTLAELIVPLLCAVYFFWKREIAGTAFCGFWFFENFHEGPENRRGDARDWMDGNDRGGWVAGVADLPERASGGKCSRGGVRSLRSLRRRFAPRVQPDIFLVI